MRYLIAWEDSSSSYTRNSSGNSSCRDTNNSKDSRGRGAIIKRKASYNKETGNAFRGDL